MLLFLSTYALYLCAGWITLGVIAKYTPDAMRREIAMNGVGSSTDDLFFNCILALAYLFVLNVWPVSIYRKLRHGRVVGK